MRHVCIVGVGLIGGSLGMALRRVRRNGKRIYRVSGLGRSKAALEEAKKRGALDAFFLDIHSAVSTSDIVVLSVPVQETETVLRRILPHVKNHAVLTDVGSVKQDILRQWKRVSSRRRDLSFVGAHPLAGSEKSGIEFADENLFKNAVTILTPNGAPRTALAQISRMWNDAGASCVKVPALKHDQMLSLTSHLPHMAAFALFSIVSTAARKNPMLRRLVSNSFKDMTRIAGSDSEVWSGIIKLNRREILRAVDQFILTLKNFVRATDRNLKGRLRAIRKEKQSW